MEDRALLDAAKHLAFEEHLATAALLRALMENDTRRLYLGEGCASMFSYCTQVLHLAEGAAYNRIEAARAARTYPLILELFEQGAITLAPRRAPAGPAPMAENHAAVLASATHKSKREIRGARVRLGSPSRMRRLSCGAPTTPVGPLGSSPRQGRPTPNESPVATPGAVDLPTRGPLPVARPRRQCQSRRSPRALSDSAHRLA